MSELSGGMIKMMDVFSVNMHNNIDNYDVTFIFKLLDFPL